MTRTIKTFGLLKNEEMCQVFLGEDTPKNGKITIQNDVGDIVNTYEAITPLQSINLTPAHLKNWIYRG